MFLVLEVTSSNAAALGGASRAVFSVKGGTIGRRDGNDWVLADPHVSSRHARVRSVGGTFFMEDAESANGVTVNGTKLHPGEPFPLKEGDAIFIDPFEIAVRITATMPGAATEVHSPAPPVIPALAVPPKAPVGAYAQPGLPSVDELLGGAPAPAQPAGGLDDLVGIGSGGIPADFNPLLETATIKPATAPPPTGRDLYGKPVINDALDIRASPRPPPVPGGSAIPTNWDAGDEPAHIEPVARPAAVTPPHSPSPAPRPVTPSPVAASMPAASPGLAGSEFEALMRGAGLNDVAMSPEAMAQLGSVLRFVVEGLMEVLRARGEIKSEFRLQQTTFKQRENNPLKFSANVEDALHNLLVKRNPAYLDAPAAFEDAFTDVRSHQLAMLAGMRAAFDYMLGRFSPEALRTQFDAKPGRKVSLGFGSGGRYWESFEEYYKELTADADDCFRRLFGDQFARSYEEQLKRMQELKRREGPRS